MGIFDKLRKVFRRIVRPPIFANVYIYELRVSGVIYPFSPKTRELKRKRYNEDTLVQWEIVFPEFRTFIDNPREVERYYKDKIQELVLEINKKIIAEQRLTYKDLADPEFLLKNFPLARYFKEWLKKQIEAGVEKVVWRGVCELKLKDISAELKEVYKAEQRYIYSIVNREGGKFCDHYNFAMIRPGFFEEDIDTLSDKWCHDTG